MFANMGSPLMLFGCCHLFVGNFVIGLLEGVLLGRLFHLKRSAVGWMIVANFVSALGGVGLLMTGPRPFTWFSAQPPILQLGWLIPLLWLLSYLLTIIIEWPFCFIVAENRPRRLLRSLAMSVCAQTASYALLVPMYQFLSHNSLMTEVSVTDNLAHVKEPDATIFYINPDDNAIWRINIDGSGRRKVRDDHVRQWRLIAHWKPNGKLDLLAADYPQNCMLIENFAENSFPDENLEAANRDEKVEHTYGVIDMRPVADRPWEVYQSGIGGMIMGDRHQEFEISIHTPFVTWFCRNATVLPAGQVVFEIGDQIVILDVESRKLGYITRGRGPVVVLKPLVGND